MKKIAEEFRFYYIEKLSKLTSFEVLLEVRQFLFDAMDIIEQTSEEKAIVKASSALEEEYQILKSENYNP